MLDKAKYEMIRSPCVSFLCLIVVTLKSVEKTRMNDMSKECYYQLAPDLTICSLVNGMWQLAGGHGCIDHKLVTEDMIRYR